MTRGPGRCRPWLLALALGAAPVGAQTDGWAFSAHVARATTAVAVAVRFPTGSARDEPGLEGSADLLGRVLAARATERLARGAGAVSVHVDRSATVFTLLAEPGRREEAQAILETVLFEEPLDRDAFERLRAESLASHAFQEGSPVSEYRSEVARILAPPGDPWPRVPAGTAASVAALTPAALEAFRGRHLRRDAAALAVVAPERDPPPTADAVPSGPASPAAPDTTAPFGPPAGPAPDHGMAWTAGDRIDLIRDVTSAWMTIAYPAPRSTAWTELELLVHVLGEELDPTPPDPDRYSVDVRLEAPPGGPVVVVEAAVFPEAADRWERRIRSAVQRLADQTLTPEFFRLRMRRFRATRLLAEDRPEALAERLAEDLLRQGSARDLAAEVAALDASALAGAAKSLGEPHVFRFGPDLGAGAGGRPPR